MQKLYKFICATYQVNVSVFLNYTKAKNYLKKVMQASLFYKCINRNQLSTMGKPKSLIKPNTLDTSIFSLLFNFWLICYSPDTSVKMVCRRPSMSYATNHLNNKTQNNSLEYLFNHRIFSLYSIIYQLLHDLNIYEHYNYILSITQIIQLRY